MALLNWDDSYSVHYASIDDQHKRLVDLINQLHEAMTQGKGKQALSSILAEMIDYSQTHFAYEEKLMLDIQYPNYHVQILAHAGFIEKVRELQNRYESGQQALSLDVMEFLKKWLTNHILDLDKKYSPYLPK